MFHAVDITIGANALFLTDQRITQDWFKRLQPSISRAAVPMGVREYTGPLKLKDILFLLLNNL